MANVDGGVLIGRILKEQNVKYVFAVNGGHTFPILANLRDNGIKLIHMRHEQSTAYAADAYARVSGTPGVCCVTAGCGLTNAVTGLCGAGLTNSAVICLAGQHPTTEDNIGSFQEAYGSEVVGSFAKFTKRVLDWSTIEIDLRQAFREATSAPQGVSLFEIPTNILYHSDDELRQRPGAKVYAPDDLRSQGDPRKIERTVELLLSAERPLIAGGDGIFWSDAAAELKELAELTHTPVYCRRAGQGAMDEADPLAIRGAWKKPFTGTADLVLAIGFRFWSGEKFGEAPVGTMLTEGVQKNMERSVSHLREAGAELLVGGATGGGAGYSFQNTLLRVSGTQFIKEPEKLQEEAFGNESLFVVADDMDQALEVSRRFEGNLTGCIYSHSGGDDDALYNRIAPILRRKVGRLLNDKMPTGVAVSSAMNHGGPYPATGHPGFTAVGLPASLLRFGMLQCFDNVRPHRLPPALRDQNPTGQMWRLVDKEWTQADAATG